MSNLVLILRISVIIFVVEIAIMLVISAIPSGFHLYAEQYPLFFPLVDTIILTSVCGPAIYFWAVRPFVLARDRAESLLRQQNRRFAEAQRVGHVGSWEFQPVKNTLDFTSEAYRIFGIEPIKGGVPLETYLKTLHEEDRETAEIARADLLSIEKPYNVVYRVLKADDGVKWVRERGHVEIDSHNISPKIFGTFHDITPQKEAEISKSLFVANISHELRTPLTSIKGSLGLIESGVAGDIPEKVKAMVDVAYRNSNRLITLINDILDLKKIEAGKMDFRMAVIDLAALVVEAIEANEAYGAEYGVSFKALVHHKPALVEGDKDRLMQVMSNLLSNAAKFSPKGGQVDVSLSRDGENIVVSVHDDGSGIPEEAQVAIFEDFTQAHSAKHRSKGGTGLGLSIAKQIVERHGGTISLSSEEGKGTTFFVRLKPH